MDIQPGGEPVIIQGLITIPYKLSVGALASKFFHGLREKRIMGVRCSCCNRTYLPPRAVCPECYQKLEQWVELNGRGKLVCYTVVNYKLPVHPIEPPIIYGIFLLDGADTGLVHFLGEVELAEIKLGMMVEPVFKESTKGDILDIKYFRPLSN